MTTTTPSAVLVPVQPVFTDAERLVLAGYRGLTRDAYALDLHQFTTWCRNRSLPLFAVRRADIESFARDLEERSRPRVTVTRRLCTIAGVIQIRDRGRAPRASPAVHVRRPRLDYESHAVALDRNELGALLVAAGLGMVTIPLAPRTARAIDLAVGERDGGPVFLAADARRLDRHGAARIVRRVARCAEIIKIVTPHTLRHAVPGHSPRYGRFQHDHLPALSVQSVAVRSWPVAADSGVVAASDAADRRCYQVSEGPGQEVGV